MNKNQNWRRVLSLLFVMAMLVGMMVVGSVVASADEPVAMSNDEYLADVQAKLEAGESVTLTQDILITDYSLFHAHAWPSNGNGTHGILDGNGAIFHITKPGVVLDLNGHSIVWDAHSDAYCNKRQVSLFMVTATGNEGETSDFTVIDSVGTGKVDVYGMPSAMYVVLSTAKATINGGTWTNYPCNTCDATNVFMYPSHGGALYINGGTFEQKVDDPYLLYAVLSSEPTNSNSVGVDYDQTKVVISGGTFVGTNPADIKFADTKGKLKEYNACSEESMIINNGDGTYGVKKIVLTVNGAPFSSWEDAAATITANTGWAPKQVDIVLYSDVNSAKYGFNANGTVNIDLNGHNWTVHQCGISYNTVITVTNSSDVEGQVLTAGADNRLYLGANSVVNLVGNVSFDGTLQMNNGGNDTTGYFRIDGENLIGEKDSLFNCPNGTMRITMKNECMNITLIYGVLTLTGEYNTLPGQSIKIDTGITVAAGATLTIDPATAITLHQNAVINGEGTVSVGSLEHLLLVLNKTEIKNVDIHTAFACDGAVLEYADVNYTGAANLLGSGAVVKAGTFDVNVQSLCAEGYATEQNNDGTWTVVPGVVKIGDVYYASLAAAANAVQNGETVTLITDLTLKSTVTFGYSAPVVATLDLNGFTVTAPDAAIVAFRNGTVLTLTNGTLKGNSTNGTLRATYRGALVLGDNLAVYSGAHADAIVLDNGNLSVEVGATIEVDGTINCLETQGSTVNNINITGGTFIGSIVINAQSTCVITGGKFTVDVNLYCAEGYCAELVDDTWYVVDRHNYESVYTAPTFEADGFTTITCTRCGDEDVVVDENTKLQAVAEVNGVLYASLQEAINACKNGETVKVLADLVFGADDVVNAIGGATGFGKYPNPTVLYVGGTAGSPNMPSEVNVVIDLNGHTLTNNANAYFFMIMDNAKVTFTDSVGNGKMNTNADGPVLWVIGTETLVTIQGGCFETISAEGVIHVTHGGDLVIEGGEFKTTADDASLLLMLNTKDRQNSANFITGAATITVKGGTFHGFNPKYVGDDKTGSIKFVNGCAEGYVPVENEDGSFGVQKKIFKSYNLLLGNTIGIYFNLDMDAINVQTWNKLTLVVYDAAGNTVEIPYSEWKNGKVLFNGLAAKQMSDEFYAQVFYNGEALSEKSPVVSVKDYAEIILNSDKYDESAKNLVKALLNYGAQAQGSFGHNTDDLANDILADADKVVAAPEVSADTVKDTGYYGASLNAETNVQFNFKFYASAVEGATKVVVTYGDTTLELDLAEVELATETKKGQTLVVVTLDTLVIADANELLECKFVDAEGNVYAEATDSIASYCARAIAGLSALEETAYEKQNFKLEFYYSIMNYANAVVAYNNK